MKNTILFILILGVAVIFAEFSFAQNQSPNIIYGYVRNGDGMPMAGAEIWYCTSTVPEPFSECKAIELGMSSNNGLWSLTAAQPNFYYRIWATYPYSYSQTETFSYTGGVKYWGTLVLANNPQPSKPAIRLVSPNGGEKFSPGSSVAIRWNTYNVVPEAEVSLTLFRSDTNPVKELICDISANCTTSNYNWVANVAYRTKNDGSETWVVPTVPIPANDYFLRVSCHSPYCGSDDSDNPFSIGFFTQALPASSPLVGLDQQGGSAVKGPPPPPPSLAGSTALPSAINVKGTAKLANGNLVDAFVWAWSEKGKSVSVKAGLDGAFDLALTRDDLWHIDAAKVINEVTYTYSDTIDIAASSATFGPLEIALVSELLPPAVILIKPASEEVTAKVEDGASVVIPAGAALLSGNVTVEIQPTVEAPSFIDEIASFLAVKIVSTVYDLVIKDQQGKEIKELHEAIEILLPYKDEDLKKLGVSEDKIYAAFFDELKGVWVKIGDYVIDKLKNVIRAKVKHLTRFAIVAPADVTPPLPPTQVKAVNDLGRIKITWQNPTRDFHHAKIYRAETKGDLGKIIANEVYTQQYLDKTIIGGVWYYYLVRTIDPAGNESINKIQTALKSSVKIVFEPAPSSVVGEAPVTADLEEMPQRPSVEKTVIALPLEEQKSPGFFVRMWRAIINFFKKLF